MKKLLPAIILSLFTMSISAQEASIKTDGITKQSKGEKVSKEEAESLLKTINKKKSDQYRASVSNWYSVGSHSDDFYGGVSDLWRDYLHPDSAKGEYSNGVGTIGILQATSLIDPLSTVFNVQVDNQFVENLAFTVDSIEIPVKYVRNLGSSVVDTLIVEVGSDENWSEVFFANNPSITANFGVDTLFFKLAGFDAVASGIGPLTGTTKKVTLKIPLDSALAADTIPGGVSIVYADLGSIAMNGGENVAVAVRFKPGYSWSVNDTVSKTKNSLQFFSWEEQGGSTYQIYTPGEWNTSYICTYDNLDPLGVPAWYETPLPSWVYTAPYSMEHHWFNVKLSYDDDWFGIEESANGISTQAFPNPANDKTLITYSIEKRSDLSLKVFDITGKLLETKLLGDKSAGSYSVELDLSDYETGIYFYDLNGVTNKIVVRK